MVPQPVTPPMSPYEPTIWPAAGVHDPESRRVHFFQDFVDTEGHQITSIRIGRDKEQDIVLRNEYVSRRHAIIYRDDSDPFWRIIGDAPGNGLYVNGEPVFEPVRLIVGMRIRLAGAILLTVDNDGRILIPAFTDDDFLCKSGELYGSNAVAAKHVGKGEKAIAERRLPPYLRKKRREARRQARLRSS